MYVRQDVHNDVLLALPKNEFDSLFRKIELVSLPAGTILNEATERIDSAFFPNNGLVFFVTMMAGEKRVEVGVTGKDGFVGVPLAAGLSTSPSKSVVRIACSGLKTEPLISWPN
jgi:hypothetical protein